MADYKLYCFGESGNSYKAALPLSLSGLDWEAVYVDFFGGESRSPEYRANVNAFGEAPALVHADEKIAQSGVIQSYITERSGKFDGKTDAEKRQIQAWVLWDNHKLSSMAGLTRFLMNFIPEDKRPKDVIAFNQSRLSAAYNILNTALENRDWLVGNGVTNADFSCRGYLYYPEPFGFLRSDYANINRWLTNIEALNGYKAPYDLMPGSPADRA